MTMWRVATTIVAVCAAVGMAACGATLAPCFANCGDPLPPAFQPDPASAVTTVTLTPSAAWADSGMTVRKGEWLLFSASGDVAWQTSRVTTGPDGDRGVPGWTIGAGGLLGRVGPSGDPFEIGARTGLFPDRHPRPPHHPFPPPAIRMRQGGSLYLGFKNFQGGANTGMYEVTIRRAITVRK